MNIDFSILKEYLPMFWQGFLVTLQFTGLSLLLGFVTGFILAMIKTSKAKAMGPLRAFAVFYTSVFRGTPQLVQLFLVYYATPQLLDYNISPLLSAVLCFGLNTAAYISESLKGGILGIDKGQLEAADALGISYFRTMVYIVFPQALKVTLPSIVNEVISLLKGSSLVSVIACMDLMRAATRTVSATFHAFEPYIFVAVIYYILVVLLSWLSRFLERKVSVSDSN